MGTMTVECAWCKRTIGKKPCSGKGRNRNQVSHGICDECAEAAIKEVGLWGKDYGVSKRQPSILESVKK